LAQVTIAAQSSIDMDKPSNAQLKEHLRAVLTGLFDQQLLVAPDEYLRYHSSRQAIASRVESFLAYKDFLPESGRILDWGCHYAPDACMVRATLGKSISLVGCDFVLNTRPYGVFWDYSEIQYFQLSEPVALPFAEDNFDCVIGGGVLEHTAMDYESLKELYRILKPDGTLILTYLPNALSYAEFVGREIRKRDFHLRRYSPSSISSMLKHAGFNPVKVRRYRFLPTNALQSITRRLSQFEPVIDRIWPFNLFCGDILAISKKVTKF
jgi:SAM-dependent methyltransferase